MMPEDEEDEGDWDADVAEALELASVASVVGGSDPVGSSTGWCERLASMLFSG